MDEQRTISTVEQNDIVVELDIPLGVTVSQVANVFRQALAGAGFAESSIEKTVGEYEYEED